MNRVYLSLGTNRGNRGANLNKAIELVAASAGKIVDASPVYETLPWKMEDEVNFYNQVILLDTDLSAIQLMNLLIQVEKSMGRLRTQKKYEPRIIDLDILFFNEEIINEPDLIVPHPLLHERLFVLQPITEIAPAYIHPVFRKSLTDLLKECPDRSKNEKQVLK